MSKEEAKNRILDLIEEAIGKAPKSFEPDLPALEGFPEVPSWHDYEHEIWKLGEGIRQLLVEHKSLRKDDSITEKILDFCLNKNAKRGRESFVMLLWYKHNQKYADKLISLINDQYVYGHVIQVLNKMQAHGFKNDVLPFTKDKRTWIRNQAKKYLEKYGTQHGV